MGCLITRESRLDDPSLREWYDFSKCGRAVCPRSNVSATGPFFATRRFCRAESLEISDFIATDLAAAALDEAFATSTLSRFMGATPTRALIRRLESLPSDLPARPPNLPFPAALKAAGRPSVRARCINNSPVRG